MVSISALLFEVFKLRPLSCRGCFFVLYKSNTFQKYFDTMFKKTDPKQVQKALNSVRRTYDQAYEKYLKEMGINAKIDLSRYKVI